MVKKVKLTCRDCHRHVTVNGKDACCWVDKPKKDTFKFLKDLTICEKFWRKDFREIKRKIANGDGSLFVANCKGCLK